MPCDAATLESLAVLINKYDGLSDRDRLICTASVYGTQAGFSNAQVALTQAVSNGFERLSERDLRALYLSVIC